MNVFLCYVDRECCPLYSHPFPLTYLLTHSPLRHRFQVAPTENVTNGHLQLCGGGGHLFVCVVFAHVVLVEVLDYEEACCFFVWLSVRKLLGCVREAPGRVWWAFDERCVCVYG